MSPLTERLVVQISFLTPFTCLFCAWNFSHVLYCLIKQVFFSTFCVSILLFMHFVTLCSANARKTSEGIVSNSVVYFTTHVSAASPHDPAPLKLRKILDMVSPRFHLGLGLPSVETDSCTAFVWWDSSPHPPTPSPTRPTSPTYHWLVCVLFDSTASILHVARQVLPPPPPPHPLLFLRPWLQTLWMVQLMHIYVSLRLPP